MNENIEQSIVVFLKSLRDELVRQFQALDPGFTFTRKPWNHHSGGGGEISLLHRGAIFEKVAVNWSGVSGPHFPMNESTGPYFATGVSVITHMRNPHAPTAHMNIRFIKTQSKHWFGGGYDLTPMSFVYDEDTHHFHHIAKKTLKPFGADLYQEFSENAKKYFWVPHRKKERGVGGIFFDNYSTKNFQNDLKMWTTVGKSFLEAVIPIYKKRIHLPYSEIDREKQLELRSHYAEFNLLYDRGTKFGFLSGGNPDAILCSMPPLVKWA